MTYRIALSERAIDDLDSLRQWIRREAGSRTAIDYLNRVESRIQTLAAFPNRGTPRDELVAGMRTISFERRVIIAYRVTGKQVEILRVVSAFRDPDALTDL